MTLRGRRLDFDAVVETLACDFHVQPSMIRAIAHAAINVLDSSTRRTVEVLRKIAERHCDVCDYEIGCEHHLARTALVELDALLLSSPEDSQKSEDTQKSKGATK